MKSLFLVYLLCAILLLSGTSCAPTQPEEQPQQDEKPQADYEEGVYSIEEAEFDERGWKPIATVVVEGREISKVYYDEINEENQLKSFDEEYLEQWKEKSEENLLTAIPKLMDSLLDQQDPEEVDSVSGATSTSEKFKELVADALEQTPQPKKDSGYYDGIQRAEADYDERGWKAVTSVIVEDEKITNVYYDEINKDTGKLKSYDEEYMANWKENSGTNLLLARPKLIESLISQQNAQSVDTVTGATSTSTKFKELTREALSPFGE